MINLKETTDINLIKSIISDPMLWSLTYGQGYNSINEFELEIGFTYLGIYNDNDLIGLYTYRPFNRQIAEGHVFILPKYWGTKLSHKSIHIGYEYLRNKNFIKLITSVPSNCIHVLKHLENLHFTLIGSIKDGIFFNHQLRTLFLFEKDLRN